MKFQNQKSKCGFDIIYESICKNKNCLQKKLKIKLTMLLYNLKLHLRHKHTEECFIANITFTIVITRYVLEQNAQEQMLLEQK